MSKNDLIVKWRKTVKQLSILKEEEAKLRKEVLKECFNFENNDWEGTKRFELGNGYELKAVFKLNRNLKNKNGAVKDALERIKETGVEGQFIANRLVKWKPEISVSEYRETPDNIKKIIDEVITSSPSLPALELLEPKSK